MSAKTIEVLLATYDGEQFLQAQIDSILRQSYPAVRVLARDDASRDGTRALLERAAADHPDRFTLMPSDQGTGNAKWNFMRLMAASTAEYVALSDQDDVWLPEKLARCMEAMSELERQYGADLPLLVFSDLTVVDRELNVVHPSFWAHQSIAPDKANSLPNVLAQNFLTGCTALMNRALVERSLNMPEESYMHDWWIALTASAFGQACAVMQPTMLYRQHGSNAVGAVVHGKPNLMPSLRYHEKRREQWEMSARQAIAFLKLNGHALPPAKRRILEAYALCETSPNRLVRVWTYLRHGFFQKGLRPNLAMLWYLWDMAAAKRNDGPSQGAGA